MIRHLAIAVLFLAAWIQTAQADYWLEARRCDSGDNHPDIRIVACTETIQSGRFIGQMLAIAFANRGLAYKSKGQWDSAIADFNQAIRLKPDFVTAFNSRGNTYYGKGQLDRAIEDFDKAIALQPDLAEAFTNRGNVYRKKGQLDRAIEDYDKAIRLSPEDGQILANRGLAFEKKGAPSQALRDFKRARELGYRHPLLLKKLRESGKTL